MFRKKLLSFFPESEFYSSLSPINFHLKLISPKLYYWLSLKSSLDNRRSIFSDANFSYFIPSNLVFNSIKEENFFYSYVNYSLLNWFDNYSIFVILPTVTLITFRRYFDYIFDNTERISLYIKPLLFSINYVLLMFFAHFKEYDDSLTDDENIKFLIKIIDEIIFYLEYTKNNEKNYDTAKKIAQEIVLLLEKDYEFLTFLYNTTKDVANVFNWKNYSKDKLYEYLVSGMLMDFPSEKDFQKILYQTTNKIFLKRYSLYLDADIITLCNVVWWDTIHINYLINPDNIDFLPYFADSLKYLLDVDIINKPLIEIIDNVLNFKIWWKSLINALKKYNSDNIDISVWPDMNFQQVQELLSKATMDWIKKVSIINEQFLDYFILLISRRYNSEWDNFQLILNNQLAFKSSYIDFVASLGTEANKKMLNTYVFLDKNYFKCSYFYKNKKKIENPRHFYSFYRYISEDIIFDQWRKILLEEFTTKVSNEKILLKWYIKLFEKYFKDDVYELISEKWYKNYIKYLSKFIYVNKIIDSYIVNFKNNIYYPDFLLFYNFLKNYEKKIWLDLLIIFSQLKRTLFWYLIARQLVKDKDTFTKIWKWALFFYKYDENIDKLLDNFDKYDEFIYFFVKVKQNKKFVSIVEKTLDKIDLEHKWRFLFDATRNITLYNKRLFER